MSVQGSLRRQLSVLCCILTLLLNSESFLGIQFKVVCKLRTCSIGFLQQEYKASAESSVLIISTECYSIIKVPALLN